MKSFFSPWRLDKKYLAQCRTKENSGQCKLSILLPVYNEGVNLKVMINILNSAIDKSHEIIVVVDFKQDKSIPIVEELQKKINNLHLVYNNYGKGVKNAITAGVEFASGEYVLIFAADEVGPVVAIDDMLELMESGCEFVSCTRYRYGGRRLGGHFVGKILSTTANFIFHTLIGSKFSDSTTGIKIFKRTIFPMLKLESRPVGWAVVFEMSIKAELLGLKIGEVPIISVDRIFGGESTFKIGPWVLEYSKWFLWGILQNIVYMKGINRKSKIKIKAPCY